MLPIGGCDHLEVPGTAQPFVCNRRHVVTGFPQCTGIAVTQVLVELDPHAPLATGTSKYRSRFISAP